MSEMHDITPAEYRQMINRQRNKYSAQKTTVDGVTFASKREARRYSELLLMVAAGEITDLELQPRFVLQEAFVDNEGTRWRKIEYVGDFGYTVMATGARVVEDVKGRATETFGVKWKLVKKRYPAVVFRLV